MSAMSKQLSVSDAVADAGALERIQPLKPSAPGLCDAPPSRTPGAVSRSRSRSPCHEELSPTLTLIPSSEGAGASASSSSSPTLQNAQAKFAMRRRKKAATSPEPRPPPATTKGWTLDGLLALGPRMRPVSRVSRVSALQSGTALEAIIRRAETEGTPLIIDGWQHTPCWPGDRLFGTEWLLEHGEQNISVRNCVSREDKDILFKEFVEKSRSISEYAEEGALETERLYGKDAVCPPEWRDWLMESGLPEMLKPGGTEDVLEFLQESERVETLMCYHGVGDTFTAAHKDLCASSGQNLMCSAENGGSAFWFMACSADAPRARAFFSARGEELDHEAHVVAPTELARAPFDVYVAEQRVGDLVLVPRRSCHQVFNRGGLTTKMSWSRMTVDGLVTAFHHELPIYRRVCRPETYRVKLLVYQALLKFTRDLKEVQEEVAANAGGISTETRQQSLGSLPSCPPLSKAEKIETRVVLSTQHRRLVDNVRTLVSVFEKILKEEHQGATQCELRLARVPKDKTSETDVRAPASANSSIVHSGIPPIPAPAQTHHEGITCDFCGADVFQSFFECKRCGEVEPENVTSADSNGDRSSITGTEVDGIVICPGCYVEGRSCPCAIMNPVQRYPMDVLLRAQNEAGTLLNFEGYGKKGHSDVVKVVALSHQAIHKLVDHPGIFAAACQLLNARISGLSRKPNLSCRQGPHSVPAAGALNCKGCHAAKCFRHILADGIYASEALAWYAKDDTQEAWHGYHVNSHTREKRRRPEDLQQVTQDAEKFGGACDMRKSLVLHARMGGACLPLSANVRMGWYDDGWLSGSDSTLDSESESEGFSGAVLGEESEDDDSASVIIVPRPTSPKPTRKKGLAPTKRSSSRQVFDFIMMPTLTKKDREKYLRVDAGTTTEVIELTPTPEVESTKRAEEKEPSSSSDDVIRPVCEPDPETPPALTGESEAVIAPTAPLVFVAGDAELCRHEDSPTAETIAPPFASAPGLPSSVPQTTETTIPSAVDIPRPTSPVSQTTEATTLPAVDIPEPPAPVSSAAEPVARPATSAPEPPAPTPSITVVSVDTAVHQAPQLPARTSTTLSAGIDRPRPVARAEVQPPTAAEPLRRTRRRAYDELTDEDESESDAPLLKKRPAPVKRVVTVENNAKGDLGKLNFSGNKKAADKRHKTGSRGGGTREPATQSVRPRVPANAAAPVAPTETVRRTRARPVPTAREAATVPDTAPARPSTSVPAQLRPSKHASSSTFATYLNDARAVSPSPSSSESYYATYSAAMPPEYGAMLDLGVGPLAQMRLDLDRIKASLTDKNGQSHDLQRLVFSHLNSSLHKMETREETLMKRVEHQDRIIDDLRDRNHHLQMCIAHLERQAPPVLIQGTTINASVSGRSQARIQSSASIQTELILSSLLHRPLILRCKMITTRNTEITASGIPTAAHHSTRDTGSFGKEGMIDRVSDFPFRLGSTCSYSALSFRTTPGYPSWRAEEFKQHYEKRAEYPGGYGSEQRPSGMQPQQNKRKRPWGEPGDGPVIYERTPPTAPLADREAARREQSSAPEVRRRLDIDEYRSRKRVATGFQEPGSPQRSGAPDCAPESGVGDGSAPRAASTPAPASPHAPSPVLVPVADIARIMPLSVPAASSSRSPVSAGLGLSVDMDPRTYAASAAASHDPAVVDNPWEGYECHAPF
ncbi:hypothetical protein M0805_002729 [Coniferiporia weirii]|nr:hypothetical protein M0805_002729 [Coniferiporia weirii]